MLRPAYPNGVPADEFNLLAYFLCTVGGMSVRSVATVIGALSDEHYATLMHSIDKLVNELCVAHYDPAEVARMRDKLLPYGLDKWLAEGD